MPNCLALRRRYCGSAPTVICVAIICTSDSGASAGQDITQVISTYAEAAAKIKAAYSRIQLDETISYFKGSGQLKEEIRVHYGAKGSSRRIVLTKPDQSVSAYVSTDAYFFRVDKPSEQDEYSIITMDLTPGRDESSLLKQHAMLPFAAYSFLDFEVLDWLRRPGLTIVDVATVEREDREMIQIEWSEPHEEPDKDGRTKKRAGWFLLSPSEAWVLREFEFSYDTEASGRLHSTVVYKGDIEGIPLVESASVQVRRAAGKERPLRSSVSASFRDKPAEAAVFLPAEYGLPNSIVERREAAGIRSWLLWLGIAGVVVSIALLYFGRRKSVGVRA